MVQCYNKIIKFLILSLENHRIILDLIKKLI